MSEPGGIKGTGHLAVDVVSGQSAATSVWANSPLKILVPRPRGPSVCACLSSLGGGLVPGDELTVTLKLGEAAQCFLTTQASTKVYRNPNDLACGQHLRARLERAARLVFIPDPVQPFLGSRYCQRQEFWLAPESGLVLVDWLCSGRAARGERWAFSCFQSRNEIFFGESRVLLDSLSLDPADGPLAETYRMGRFSCLALIAVIGESVRTASTRLLEESARLAVPRQASLVCSASPIAQGALVRIAGEQVEAVSRELQRVLAFVPDLLHVDAWASKWR
jgi:urease accessory protein